MWEFWKKDKDLWPENIVRHPTLSARPHALVFVFDGSMSEIPNGEEEIKFYRDILAMARERNYYYPQIVLTKIDKVEQDLHKKLNILDKSEFDRNLRDTIELKIETVVVKLGVPRASVHFIEN